MRLQDQYRRVLPPPRRCRSRLRLRPRTLRLLLVNPSYSRLSTQRAKDQGHRWEVSKGTPGWVLQAG